MREYYNGILMNCNECYIAIKNKIKRKIPIKIPKSTNIKEDDILEFIVSTLYRIYRRRGIVNTKERVMENLLEHGQFEKANIEKIFEIYEYKEKVLQKTEIHYSFPGYNCTGNIKLGLCVMDIEILECPICDTKIFNIPDNIEKRNLVCKYCYKFNNNESETNGILRFGYPPNYGNWDKQKPGFQYTGNDYFYIFHKNCRNSEHDDKRGLMEVNGIIIDEDDGKVVLGLVCSNCGYRDALKPYTIGKKIPVRDTFGDKWIKVTSKLNEMVLRRENQYLEFKSSLRWDYNNNKENKNLENEVLKTIIAFLNSDGGELLIGVDDDGDILGLRNDYNLFSKKKDSDKFESLLIDLIKYKIGLEAFDYISIEFLNKYDKEVCYINVEKSSEPFYLKKYKKKEFYVRIGNRSQKQEEKQTEEYVNNHF